MVRLTHESSFYEEVSFVTLTYDDTTVPSVLVDDVAVLTLLPRDLTLFFKNLRHLVRPKKIKYYAVGEYGSLTQRPHYHLILFGCADKMVIFKAWKKGFVKVKPFLPSAVKYVTKYIHKSDQRLMPGQYPPFKRQSTALGKRYALENADVFRKRLHLRMSGFRYPLPRYYRKVLGITELDYSDIIFQREQDLFVYFLQRYPLKLDSLTPMPEVNINSYWPYFNLYQQSLLNQERLLTHRLRHRKSI